MSTAKEVKVPDIGDFSGVEIIDVLVKPGDEVHQEESIITLESDKAAMDVPMPFTGKVSEVKVKTGDQVSEGDVILLAEVEDSGEASEASDEEESESEAETETAEKSTPSEEPVAAQEPVKGTEDEKVDRDAGSSKESDFGASSIERPRKPDASSGAPQGGGRSITEAHAGPSVRKFARELGVDLSRVSGSGRKGRILHADVKAFVKAALKESKGAAIPSIPTIDFSKFGEVEHRPLSRIKRISGPRLQAAWLNAPHVTQHDEADITAMETVRKALKSTAESRGAKLTPLAFLIKASVEVLKAMPDFNASLDPDGKTLIMKRYFHIGFAVDTSQGLMVPVIRDVDQKDIFKVAVEVVDKASRARNGKLRRDEIEGGCFSISSLGGIGGTAFTPIINVPEVAILGVSKSAMKPTWTGSSFEPRLMLPLSLSYDHRVIDGAMAVRFTRQLAEILETLHGVI